MKRFYYSGADTGGWIIYDRLYVFGYNGAICRVEDPAIANIICDALNEKLPQRSGKPENQP